DVVHLNSFGHGAIAWRSPVVITAHSCVVSWWAAVKGEPLPAAWNRYREHVGASLRAVTHITAPSHAMSESLSQNYAVPEERITTIPNGRAASKYRAAEKEPFILAAGRLWDEAKNVASIVKIAPQLSWPVYLAGERTHANGSVADCGACQVLGPLPPAEL